MTEVSMNNVRRKKISQVIENLNDLALNEQEAFDNLPENIQFSERGEKMEEWVTAIETARDELQTMLDCEC